MKRTKKIELKKIYTEKMFPKLCQKCLVSAKLGVNVVETIQNQLEALSFPFLLQITSL
jgi:hypothetical protein